MTRDEIMKMAHESGLVSDCKQYDDWIDAGPGGEDLITFAKLVAAKEREACLEICRERMKDAEAFCKRVGGEYHEGRWNGAIQIEEKILKRNSQ